ncbi:MAG: sigma-70 family RNA polymerase sigma factor [Planctomycetota bacterium]
MLETPEELAAEFDLHRERLKRLIQFRMDHRLGKRLDASDVLQEAFLDLAQRLPEFPSRNLSPFVWFRLVAMERLISLHRTHLKAKMRDARRDFPIDNPMDSDQTRTRIAAGLVDQLTSVSNKVIAREQSARLRDLLETMSPVDQEIIAMRIFEDLSNKEIAEVLQISKHAASRRFLNAMERLRIAIGDDSPVVPGAS